MKRARYRNYFVLALAVLFAVACMFGLLSGCSAKDGQFYTLQEAYKKGFLSKDDLKAIAEEGHRFDRADLDEEIQEAIKTDYLEYWEERSEEELLTTVAYIDIWDYWGEYHGFYVVQLAGPNNHQYPAVARTDVVAGVEIPVAWGPELLVWKNTVE